MPFDRKQYLELDGRSKQWVRQEVARRRALEPDHYCKTVLLSYPRSGNHLVRFLVESVSRRPTLSAMDIESSILPLGLHDRPAFLKTDGIRVSNPQPILIKRHNILANDQFEKMIFLRRDPVEAVLSHLKHEPDEGFSEKAVQEVALYNELIGHFDAFPASGKIVITYEELLADPHRTAWSILQFLGLRRGIASLRLMRAIRNRQNAFSTLERKPETKWQGYRSAFPDRAIFVDSLIS